MWVSVLFRCWCCDGGGGCLGVRSCVLFGWPVGGPGGVWAFGFGHCPNVSWDPNSSVTQEYHDYKKKKSMIS